LKNSPATEAPSPSPAPTGKFTIRLKDRVKVTYRNDDGEDITENVTVIDWQTPTNNDFFLASQLWIAGEMYTRRPT
jgi:type I site-specific restriction-modification system R (restriction) subunit